MFRSACRLSSHRIIGIRYHSTAEILYHKRADEYLDGLLEYLEIIGDDNEIKGFDILYSTGVMTLTLGEKGTFVLNKQPPNRQLWLSSPISYELF